MSLLPILAAEASKFPWIGYITSTFPNDRSGGTGSLIAPRLVLTAAHVLFDPVSRQQTRRTKVIFGGSSQSSYESTEVDFPIQWRTGGTPVSHSLVSPYDIGIVVLPEAIDRVITPVQFQTASDGMLDGMTVNVAGYPILNGRQSTLYGRSSTLRRGATLGNLEQYSSWRLFYPVDTLKGMSGGPVYDFDPASNVRTIRGIHTSLIDRSYASALRINEDIYELLQFWITKYRP